MKIMELFEDGPIERAKKATDSTPYKPQSVPEIDFDPSLPLSHYAGLVVHYLRTHCARWIKLTGNGGSGGVTAWRGINTQGQLVMSLSERLDRIDCHLDHRWKCTMPLMQCYR